MRTSIFIFCLMLLFAKTSAQNDFTFADNGTFESTSWVQPLLDYNAANNTRNPWIVSIERGDIAYEGSHSAKITLDINEEHGSVIFPIYNNGSTVTFAMSVWIYVPSAENNLPQGTEFPYPSDFQSGRISFHTTGFFINCGGGGYPTSLQTDTWIQFNPLMSASDIMTWVRRDINQTQNFVFYMDKMEARRDTPIQPNPTFGPGSVTLNPSGGLQIFPGNPHPVYDYRFHWNDIPDNTSARSALDPGIIYTVYIDQGKVICWTQADFNHNVFNYIVGPPVPPAVNNLIKCVGETGQLTASSSVSPLPSYYRFAWYDAPTGGTLLGTTSSLSVGPKSIAGDYKYYAQIDITGSVAGPSSLRTEATFKANPSPAPQIGISTNILYRDRPVTLTAASHQPDYTYNYSFQYGTGDDQISDQITNGGPSVSYSFEDQGTAYPAFGPHNVAVSVTGGNGCSSIFNFNVLVKDILPLCETIIPKVADEINLDKFSGRYVFQRNQNCSVDIVFGCIQGKVDLPLVNNVVATSATTYSDDWDYGHQSTVSVTGNAFEKGEAGKWRPNASYSFNKGPVTVDKNYNSGRFQLSHFNWQYPNATSKVGWLKTNEIKKYSPHGDPVEEVNALNILSAAKFGYDNALPYLIAQNADYNSVFFESFEKDYDDHTLLEDGTSLTGGTRDRTNYHAGNYSLKLTSSFVTRDFKKSSQVETKGLLVRAWIRTIGSTAGIQLSIPGYNVQRNFTTVASSGEWILVEAKVEAGSFTVPALPEGQTFNVQITKTGAGEIWIDDLRIQPFDAEMTCYVYDERTLRVLTILDEQHFGLYYQYNAEGKLIRKLIETEKGIKTVQETQYNLKKKDKSEFTPQ